MMWPVSQLQYNGLEMIGIALGTFMVCFYTIYVMRDWGVINDKKDSWF